MDAAGVFCAFFFDAVESVVSPSRSRLRMPFVSRLLARRKLSMYRRFRLRIISSGDGSKESRLQETIPSWPRIQTTCTNTVILRQRSNDCIRKTTSGDKQKETPTCIDLKKKVQKKNQKKKQQQQTNNRNITMKHNQNAAHIKQSPMHTYTWHRHVQNVFRIIHIHTTHSHFSQGQWLRGRPYWTDIFFWKVMIFFTFLSKSTHAVSLITYFVFFILLIT